MRFYIDVISFLSASIAIPYYIHSHQLYLNWQAPHLKPSQVMLQSSSWLRLCFSKHSTSLIWITIHANGSYGLLWRFWFGLNHPEDIFRCGRHWWFQWCGQGWPWAARGIARRTKMCETKTSVSTKPQIIDMEDLHWQAVMQKSNTYVDPKTGFMVLTEFAQLKRGKFCECVQTLSIGMGEGAL